MSDAVSLQRHRRPRRSRARAGAQRGLAGDRRRAGARRERHRQVDDRARAGGAAAAGRRGRAAAGSAAIPRRPIRCARTARIPPEPPATVRPARLVELPVGASEDRLVGSLDLERALTARGEGVRAGAARRRPSRPALRRRGQPAARPSRRPAARRRRHGHRLRRTRRRLGAARGALPARRHDEPGGGRAAPAAARPLRARRRRARLARSRRARRGGPPPAGVRRRSRVASPSRYAAADSALASRIQAARELLADVVLDELALRQITSVCAAFDVDGLRADLVTARTAIALAAWNGRTDVTADDVRTAARLALPHRQRRRPDDPFDAPGSSGIDEETLERALADAGPRRRAEPPDDDPGGGVREPASDGERDRQHPVSGQQQPSGERPAVSPGAPYRAKLLSVPTVGVAGPRAGAAARSMLTRGRTVGARPPAERLTRLHTSATLLAAAPHQLSRGRGDRSGLLLRARRSAPGGARRPRVEPGAVLRRRQRIDGRPRADAGRQDRDPLAAARCLPAARQGRAGDVPERRRQARCRGRAGTHVEHRTGHRRSWPRCRPAAAPRSPPGCSGPRACSRSSGCATRRAGRCWSSSPTAATPRGPDPVAAAQQAGGREASRRSSSTARLGRCVSGWQRGWAMRCGGLTVPLAGLAADGLAGVVRDARRAA